MDVLEAILTRRSVRAFAPDPVPEELLLRVLEAGRRPSGEVCVAEKWGVPYG